MTAAGQPAGLGRGALFECLGGINGDIKWLSNCPGGTIPSECIDMGTGVSDVCGRVSGFHVL